MTAGATLQAERAIRRAFESGEMALAYAHMLAHKPTWGADAIKTGICVISATHPAGRGTLSDLARAMPSTHLRPNMALDVVRRLARAIENEDWYTARRMVAAIRRYAPYTGRRDLWRIIKNLRRVNSVAAEVYPGFSGALFSDLSNLMRAK